MTSFLDLAAELAGTLPGLSPILSETYVARAWEDVCAARLWSFLSRDAAIPLPTQVIGGTFTATQFGTTLTADATATAALTPLLTATPPLVGRQIRLQGRSLYTITIAAGSPLVLTLDRVYQEASGAGQAYQVYQAYIPVPAPDFLRWTTLDDYQNGYAITGDRLMRSRTEFDRRDPQRQSQGLTYFLGQFKSTAGLVPKWEFWPHPTSGQIFIAAYQSKGTTPDYTDETSALPETLPSGLVMIRALGWHAYPWVQANRGGFPRYAKTDFLSLITDAKAQYHRLLVDAKRVDDEQALQTVYNRGVQGRGRRGFTSDVGGPADAAWWQRHGVFW
jgi:hypothetical protein